MRHPERTPLLKILTDTPSDNGNRFLCLECQHACVRSGTRSEIQIHCGSYGPTGPSGAWRKIDFVVTKCSEFATKNAWKDKAIKTMQSQAYYIDASQEGRGIVLLPPDEAKRRDLWDEI